MQRGEWHRPFPRVYILGDAGLVPLAIESAALLCFGEDTVLSHRTAAALWGLVDPRPRTIDLTVAGYTVIRISQLQLTNEPYRVIATIAQALGRAAIAA